MKSNSRKAVVLLSGGLDSTTVLFLAMAKGFDCHCLLFDYGQRHQKELAAAQKIAKSVRCKCSKVRINLPWGGSSLLDKHQVIPFYSRSLTPGSLPSTYVPGRNTIFLSYAISLAETINASTVFIGANAVDYSGYPDCRPNYYKSFNRLLKALDNGIQIRVPLINMKKSGIIRLGTRLGVPYGLTWSCYKGGKIPCGVCDSCGFRAKGFKEARVKDPALTVNSDQ